MANALHAPHRLISSSCSKRHRKQADKSMANSGDAFRKYFSAIFPLNLKLISPILISPIGAIVALVAPGLTSAKPMCRKLSIGGTTGTFLNLSITSRIGPGWPVSKFAVIQAERKMNYF
jgi:hypothetical protein